MVKSTTRAYGGPEKYIQGPGEFDNLEKYTRNIGKNLCFVIDGFLYEDLNKRLENIYSNTDANIISINFRGECCQNEIDRIVAKSKDIDVDLFVGIGGGKTMDVAKLCATEMDLPLVIVPTSVSTDAPVSEIAVMYSEDGVHLGSRKMKNSAKLILVDSEIVVNAPKRLFIAGIGDALATVFEAQATIESDSKNYIGEGFRSCIAGEAIAKACYETILRDSELALEAVESGVVTRQVENIIEANTLLSGLGFCNTGLTTAHGVHSGMTAVASSHGALHGEKVSFGLLVQLILENKDKKLLDEILEFMVKIGLPTSLEDVGIEATDENIKAITNKTVNENKLIHSEPFLIDEKEVYSSIVLADKLGRKAKDKYNRDKE